MSDQWLVARYKREPGSAVIGSPLVTRRYTLRFWRGTQVVRERSAKPLCGSSILPRASNLLNNFRALTAFLCIASISR